MEIHLETLRYVSEQFEEFLLEERENGREDSVRVEHMLQQRLAASFAARV